MTLVFRLIIFILAIWVSLNSHAAGLLESLRIAYAPSQPKPPVYTPSIDELNPEHLLRSIAREHVNSTNNNTPESQMFLRTYSHLARHLKALQDSAVSLGFSPMEERNTAFGIVYSDYGKGQAGKDLLIAPQLPEAPTKESTLEYKNEYERIKKIRERSIKLIKILSGQTAGMSENQIKASQIIRDLAGGYLLPNHLDISEIREALKVPGMTGYLHEIPGIIFAIEAFEKGLAPEEFKVRIQSNLFHNGPNAGFWKDVLETMVKSKLSNHPKLGEKLKDFFKGTVFENGYPSPNNKYSLWHTLLDRLDQSTGGGHLKIRSETQTFVPIQKLIHEMLHDNPEGTLKQLEILEEQAHKILKDQAYEKNLFHKMLSEAKDRIRIFQQQAKHKIKVSYGDKSSIGTPIGVPGTDTESKITQIKIGKNIYSPSEIPFSERKEGLNYFKWESPEELKAGINAITTQLKNDWEKATGELNQSIKPMDFSHYANRFGNVVNLSSRSVGLSTGSCRESLIQIGISRRAHLN